MASRALARSRVAPMTHARAPAIAIDRARGRVARTTRERARGASALAAKRSSEDELARGVQGGVTKRRCDACLGTGATLCPSCNDVAALGWTIDGNAQRCERRGYVPTMSGGVLGFGAKKTGEERCGRCNDPAGEKNPAGPGRVTCARCRGAKFLLYRNADWR